jgi:hypothetical protein
MILITQKINPVSNSALNQEPAVYGTLALDPKRAGSLQGLI